MRHKSHRHPSAPARSVAVEACVQTLASAQAAERIGVDRIELCSGLAEGGVTPGAGLIREVRRRVGIPVFLLIRPRAGDFVPRGGELEVMLQEVREARRAGMDGVVFGVLDPSGTVDRESCARLVETAGPLPVTFHRAFDRVQDQGAALETLIGLGISRVLTSGGAPRATEGIARIGTLVRQGGDRISVMAGGTVRAGSVEHLVAETGVREVHLGPTGGPAGDLDVAAVEALLALLTPRTVA